MKDLHNAPDIRIRGWIVVLAVAGFAQASCALAQIYKCTDADGRTAFSDKPCATPPPGAAASAGAGKDGVKQEVLRQPKSSAGSTSADAMKESSARPAAASASVFPEMQAGKWKLRSTGGRAVRENEMCGDPLDSFRREVQSYEANKTWGCTMTTSASGPRSVRVVYDCPADRSPDGRAVSKGRSELSLVSASPQAFRVEMKSTVYPGYVMEGTRIGDCEQR